MLKNKNTAGNIWIDPDDAPELTRDWFEKADLYDGDRLIRRGRPPQEHHKQRVTLRLDDNIVSALRATGKGWQTRLNDFLNKAIEQKLL